MKTPAEILASHSVVDADTGCHNWTAALYHNGYGMTKVRIGGRPYCRAHRAAYVLAKGEIPEGLQVDHLCRNRRCINAAHLECVSLRENVLRGNGPFVVNRRKTHCARGHPFTEQNTYRQPSRPERRLCKTCRIEDGNLRRTKECNSLSQRGG